MTSGLKEHLVGATKESSKKMYHQIRWRLFFGNIKMHPGILVETLGKVRSIIENK